MSKYSIPSAGDSDMSGAARTASEYAGDAGQEDFFSSILGSLSGKHEQFANEDVDEEKQQDLVKTHQSVFGNGDSSGSSFGSSSLGGAAAMQALKMFTGGQGMGQVASGGGGPQNAFVGMAMGEAAKLFEQQSAQGNTQDGVTKDSVVQHAAETAFKIFLQSQGSGSASGASSLMGLASKSM